MNIKQYPHVETDAVLTNQHYAFTVSNLIGARTTSLLQLRAVFITTSNRASVKNAQRPGGDSTLKMTGVLVGNFEKNP